MPYIARLLLKQGACGIAVGKVGEADVYRLEEKEREKEPYLQNLFDKHD